MRTRKKDLNAPPQAQSEAKTPGVSVVPSVPNPKKRRRKPSASRYSFSRRLWILTVLFALACLFYIGVLLFWQFGDRTPTVYGKSNTPQSPPAEESASPTAAPIE